MFLLVIIPLLGDQLYTDPTSDIQQITQSLHISQTQSNSAQTCSIFMAQTFTNWYSLTQTLQTNTKSLKPQVYSSYCSQD